MSGPLPLAAFLACSSGTTPLDTSSSSSGATSGGSAADVRCRPLSVTDAGPPQCFQPTLVEVTGDLSTCDVSDSGYGSTEFCDEICGPGTYCTLSGSTVDCRLACAVDGRRYVTLDDEGAPRAVDVGSYLARMAFFEAASVDAFGLLAADLARHGAPDALVRGCRKARRDEVRHAAMARELATSELLAEPPAPRIDRRRAEVRSLFDIARENAVEGCVKEAFGVLLGMWQAEHAESDALRTFFEAIVRDERRHAALSMRIDEWARTQLDPEERRALDAARNEALERTRQSLAAAPLEGLGLPSPREALALFDAFRQAGEPQRRAA